MKSRIYSQVANSSYTGSLSGESVGKSRCYRAMLVSLTPATYSSDLLREASVGKKPADIYEGARGEAPENIPFPRCGRPQFSALRNADNTALFRNTKCRGRFFLRNSRTTRVESALKPRMAKLHRSLSPEDTSNNTRIADARAGPA